LNHSAGEAEKFYRELAARGVSVRVGMEATGYSRRFERLLAELRMELWIGDAAVNTKNDRPPRGAAGRISFPNSRSFVLIEIYFGQIAAALYASLVEKVDDFLRFLR
jgi:hypothetical protein